jgi:hypothetical protein
MGRVPRLTPPLLSLLLLVLALALVAVWLLGSIPGEGPLVQELQDAGHFPLLAIRSGTTFLLTPILLPAPSRRTWYPYAATGGVILLVSGIGEWTQQFLGRDASLSDLAMNIAGSAAAVSVLALIDFRAPYHAPRMQFKIAIAAAPLVLTF